ncbi:hypothetical protein GIB67_010128 [Kingdonia uniflora]|uniref:BHLH domain-containing protein n=1 Tax=Kingdonia uniflora TaxID=39325 RepID=A0A7J7NBC5_9MAGN|nr:hypothetical protein GIB67_010128 [Kingdonia uniflora]
MVFDDDDRSSSSEEDATTQAHQLQILQTMIPNITKTDKRSILEETRAYLQSIHAETKQIETELLQQPYNIPSSSVSENNGTTPGPKIRKVEIEKVMEGRFVVKISWRRGLGVAGHVQHVLECLDDIDMTSIVVNEDDPDDMLTTAFVNVISKTSFVRLASRYSTITMQE